MQLSVLMSVYSGTNVGDLTSCLESIKTQTLLPDEIIMVLDGPLSEDTANYINMAMSSLPIKTISFSENRGLGYALRDGLLHCRHELVARVDTDDICLPDRLSKQVNYLYKNPDVALVGSMLKEWYDCLGNRTFTVRSVPLDSEKIAIYARRRNPFNHPTVLFRKSAVLASGNYESCLMFEDYFLWARMIKAGFRLANIPEVLVETQADSDYFRRRGGLKYLRYEFHFVKKLVAIGFLSQAERARFLLERLPFRILPKAIRSFLYQCFLRVSDKQSHTIQ